MRILPIIAVSALTLASLSGCTFAVRGPAVTEDRSIDIATAVVLETSGSLTISEGEPSLVIHAPQGVLDRLTSAVKGDTLTLGVTPGTPGFLLGKISYELTLPSLEDILIDGSGDVYSDIPGDDLTIEINGSGGVDIDSIDASSVSVQVNGSGDIELSGKADELAVSIDGSADVRADELDAVRVSVEINGSGDVTVSASGTLDAAISGAGSIIYEGRPEVTQDISGSGEVARRG